MRRARGEVRRLRRLAASDAPQDGVDEPARAPRRQLHGFRDRGVLRDVHVEQLIRAEPQHVEQVVVDLALGQRLHGEVEPRPPPQHAQHQRAHEPRLADEEQRGKGGLALDAAKELQRAAAVIHRGRLCA